MSQTHSNIKAHYTAFYSVSLNYVEKLKTIADVVYSLFVNVSSLKVHGPDLHFSSLSGVTRTLPFNPVDTTIMGLGV